MRSSVAVGVFTLIGLAMAGAVATTVTTIDAAAEASATSYARAHPDEILPGYETVDAEFEIEFKPGEWKNFTGTVEEVLEQVKELNPEGYMTAMFDDDLGDAEEAFSPVPDKDANTPLAYNICDVPGGYATIKRIKQGINYLDKLKSTPRFKAGPRKCSRVSCSHQSGISVCNDNRSELKLKTWTEVATAAANIVQNCFFLWDDNTKIKGQRFFKTGYNVIVKWHPAC